MNFEIVYEYVMVRTVPEFLENPTAGHYNKVRKLCFGDGSEYWTSPKKDLAEVLFILTGAEG